jgi:hypothetical protein
MAATEEKTQAGVVEEETVRGQRRCKREEQRSEREARAAGKLIGKGDG